jgi:hypothetical protein
MLEHDRKQAGWSVRRSPGLQRWLRQPGFATVSRMAASSNASSVWRASGTMSTVPLRTSQDVDDAFHHGHNRLTQHLCVSTNDRFCTPAAVGVGCSLELLASEGVQ